MRSIVIRVLGFSTGGPIGFKFRVLGIGSLRDWGVPDPLREDLESRFFNVGPYTTKGSV